MYMFFIVIALYDILRTFVVNMITMDRQDMLYEIMQQNATILNHLTKRAPIYIYDQETDAFLKEEAQKHYAKHIDVQEHSQEEEDDDDDFHSEAESDDDAPPNVVTSTDAKKEQ